MTAHAYTEDQLVGQPAIGLFASLGWHIACGNPHPGPLPVGEGAWIDGTGGFGCETMGDELARDGSAMSLETASREAYRVLSGHIDVEVLAA